MRIELNRTEKALTDRSLLGLTELNEARADDDDEEDVGIKYQKPDGRRPRTSQLGNNKTRKNNQPWQPPLTKVCMIWRNVRAAGEFLDTCLALRCWLLTYYCPAVGPLTGQRRRKKQ